MSGACPSDPPCDRPLGASFSWLLAAIAWLLAACSGGESSPGLVVGVASSAAGALDAITAEWTASGGVPIRLSSASSSTLARQVERGSPVDVFVSADRAWVDYLVDAGLGDPESIRVLCRNRLVLYLKSPRGDWPPPSKSPIDIGASETAWVSAPEGPWSTGDPRHVPLGRYAREALLALGWWDRLEPKLLPAADARAAVRLVEMGQADFGVGYATDVLGTAWVSRPFDSDLHLPIEVIAIRTAGASEGAQAFMDYLGGPEAALHLEAAGFLMEPRDPAHRMGSAGGAEAGR